MFGQQTSKSRSPVSRALSAQAEVLTTLLGVVEE